MNVRVVTLVEQAKELTPAEQAALAKALYEMVNPTDPEWETAWAKECEDRLAAYQRGEITAVDSEEAMSFLCKKHGLK